MIVVDTNVIAHLTIGGELTLLAEQAARKDAWCAPVLWRSEYRNVLAIRLRQKMMSLDDALKLLVLAERLMWDREYTVRSTQVMEYVSRSNRSAYDCEFLVLADDLGVELVTTDEAIISEFPKTAVHLREFVRS